MFEIDDTTVLGDYAVHSLDGGAIEIYAPIADEPAQRDPYAGSVILSAGEITGLLVFLYERQAQYPELDFTPSVLDAAISGELPRDRALVTLRALKWVDMEALLRGWVYRTGADK